MSRVQLLVGGVAAVALAGVVGAMAIADSPSGKLVTAPAPAKPFLCTGTFSSGSGVAGSSMEKDGKPTCFFEADSEAEARVQRECGQSAACEVMATTRPQGDSRIVEKVLAVTRLDGPANEPTASMTADKPPLLDPSVCPSSEFGAFAKAFSGRISIQSRFVRWPLEIRRIDVAATPEPRPVTKRVGEKEMSFPIMMDMDRARREGKVVRVAQDNENSAHVEYAGSDSGEQVRYLFRRAGSCWQMVGIDDRSL